MPCRRRRLLTERAHVRFELRKLRARRSEHITRRLLCTRRMARGELGESFDGRSLVTLNGFVRAHAAGEQPQIVFEVSRDHAEITLGVEEDDGLIDDGLAVPHEPERREATGAVLAEDAVLLAGQRL